MTLAWEKLSSVGPYSLQKLLGTGGMGKVYLGRQHETDFALKFLEAPQHGETLHYFKQEARLLSLLSNPRLVKIYDFHETQNGVPPFFVMDYVAGVPLDQIPKNSSVETWLNLFMQCLEGLQYLHHRNVLHRDLKPSNILVTPNGAIKILDFSLSTRLAEGAISQRIHGGTLPYLPQEAFLGIYEKRSDLFALGVVFYQAISGRLPYSQALRPESLSSVKKPLPLRQLRGDLPEFFSDLIDRLLELHPDRRPSSALTALRYLAQHGYKSEIELGEIRELLEKPPWVDRDLEWKQTLAYLQNAWNGDAPRFITLKGPTGIGRSRFIEELRWKLLLESKNFWMIQAHEHEDWREVLCRNAELEVTALDTFGLAEALAEKTGTRSGVLALTDLHTWKEHDWENLKVFLQALHRSPSRWAVILEINSDFARLEDHFSVAMMQRLELKAIELKDLDAATTRELVLGSMAGEPLPETSIEAVVRGSGGRPLLVLESLRQILAGDGDPASILLPKNLEEAAQNKVKELSSEAQRLLAWVLSHGTDVSDADLDALDPKAMAQPKAWLELQQASILEWGERGLLTLSYPGLRQALHQALPDDLILQCHRQWLAYLESPQYPHAQNPQTVIRIMEHALALHDEATLVRHGLQALSRLDQTGEYERALVWSQTLLDLPEHPIPLSRLHAQRAPLFYRLARYPESLEAYEQWYRHRQDDESQLQRVKYFFYRGLVYFAWGKAKDCAENFQKCLSTSDPQAFPALRPYYVRAYLILASLHDQARHLPQARQCLERAAELKVEDPQLVGEIYLRLGELEMKEMHFTTAEAQFKKCLSCFERTQAPQGLGLAHNALTILYKEMGRWTEALPHAAQAVQAAKDCGEKVAWARYRGNQGVVFSDLGRHGEALQAMEDSKNILEIMGSPEENWVAQLQTIQIFLAAGNFNRANAQLTQRLKEKAELEKADLWNSLLSIRAEAAYLVRDETLADQLFGAMLNSPQGLNPLIESLTRVGIAKARFIAGVEITEEELAWRSKAEKSGSHLLACWGKTFGFLLSDPQLLSREGLESLVTQALSLGSPETRLEILTLIELGLTRHGLKTLAKSVLAERKRIWESIYHLLPEELKMDYEKNRGLFDVEKSLQQPIRQTSEAVPIAHQPQAMGVPEQAKISEDRFRQFCEITRQISQGDDLEAILEQVMDASIILTGAERGFLILKNEKVKDGAFPGFEVKTARHINQQALKEEDFQVSLSLVNKAIVQGAPVFTENALEDSRFQEMKSIHLYQLKSVVVIPLELSGKILGVLYLDHRYRPNCFSQEDLTILSGFAGQAGLAIQKAQIMRALQNANQNLETQVKDQAQQLVVLNEELTQARKNLKYEYKDIVGSSPAMIRVFKLLDHVTKTRIPVWVWGESGTGKELIAVSLHQNSPRKDGPFITENCSSIPETLLESELFGHKKGAFTHADRDRVGLFEQANGGTLFLDEVADMPLNMQAKLLRVLQEGEVRPVGSNKKIKVDVRLVTASNRDLAKMVKDGKFREDLFYRINGLTLRLPPLRERKQDIPALVHYLTKKIAREYDLKPSKLTAEAQQHLVKQDWPGNIRQLEGALRNAMMFADGEPLTPELFQSQHALMQESANHTPVVFEETADASPQPLTSEESERAQLIQALRRHHLDKNSVADELGITLKSVYVRMERHGIPKKNSLLAKFLDDQG